MDTTARVVTPRVDIGHPSRHEREVIDLLHLLRCFFMLV